MIPPPRTIARSSRFTLPHAAQLANEYPLDIVCKARRSASGARGGMPLGSGDIYGQRRCEPRLMLSPTAGFGAIMYENYPSTGTGGQLPETPTGGQAHRSVQTAVQRIDAGRIPTGLR